MQGWLDRLIKRCLWAEPTQIAAWFRMYYYADHSGINKDVRGRVEALLAQRAINRCELSELVGLLMGGSSVHAMKAWRETLRYEYSLLLNRPATGAEASECKLSIEDLRSDVAMLAGHVARLRTTRRSLSIMRNLVCAVGLGIAIAYLNFGWNRVDAAFNASPFKWTSAATPFIVMGGLGGLTSALSRLYSIEWRGPALLMYTHVASLFWGLVLNLVLASFQGIVFSIVLIALFSGSFIEGPLFPKVTWLSPDAGGWLASLAGGTGARADMGKALVWSFIAGFSERLVPDLMRQLTAQAREAGPVRPAGPAETATAATEVNQTGATA